MVGQLVGFRADPRFGAPCLCLYRRLRRRHGAYHACWGGWRLDHSRQQECALRRCSASHCDRRRRRRHDRLALWSGILSVAGLSGWLTQLFSYETVFLLGLVVPPSSSPAPPSCALAAPHRDRSIGASSAADRCSAPWSLPLVFAACLELVFLISVTIIGLMLARVAQDVDEQHRRKILFAALVIFFIAFFYRATPG
jgi:hypothetical protein